MNGKVHAPAKVFTGSEKLVEGKRGRGGGRGREEREKRRRERGKVRGGRIGKDVGGRGTKQVLD